MFWAGQLNAILLIATFGGTFLIGILFGAGEGVAWFFFMFAVRVAIKLVDVVWTAFTGSPLVYQVKVLPTRRGGDDADA